MCAHSKQGTCIHIHTHTLACTRTPCCWSRQGPRLHSTLAACIVTEPQQGASAVQMNITLIRVTISAGFSVLYDPFLLLTVTTDRHFDSPDVRAQGILPSSSITVMPSSLPCPGTGPDCESGRQLPAQHRTHQGRADSAHLPRETPGCWKVAERQWGGHLQLQAMEGAA